LGDHGRRDETIVMAGAVALASGMVSSKAGGVVVSMDRTRGWRWVIVNGEGWLAGGLEADKMDARCGHAGCPSNCNTSPNLGWKCAETLSERRCLFSVRRWVSPLGNAYNNEQHLSVCMPPLKMVSLQPMKMRATTLKLGCTHLEAVAWDMLNRYGWQPIIRLVIHTFLDVILLCFFFDSTELRLVVVD
jgi:hypothetical protein